MPVSVPADHPALAYPALPATADEVREEAAEFDRYMREVVDLCRAATETERRLALDALRQMNRTLGRTIHELSALCFAEPAGSVEARVVAETDRIIDEASDREQGEEP